MSELLPNFADSVEHLKQFALVYLIALDLDGTLYRGPSHTLEEKVQKAIRNLYYQKVHVTLATGRTYCGVLNMCEALDIRKGTPLVLYNGSIVANYGHSTLLRRAVIPQQAFMNVLAAAALFPCEVFAYTCQDASEIFGAEDHISEQVFDWEFGLGSG